MAQEVRTNGFSSESAIVDVTYEEGGVHRSRCVVLRLPPTNSGVFPVYDLERQAKVQALAADHGIPVPGVIGVETDPAWVGTSFFAMDYVEGRIPADDAPQYCAAGWLYEADAAQQRGMYEDFHNTLAAINSIGDDQADLSFLARAEGPGLRGELEWWSNHLHWATDGSPPAIMLDTLAWLSDTLPEPEPPSTLIWGDAKFGNVIFDDDFSVRAVLDWEMAAAGPAEVDLGWSFANRRSIQLGNGLPLDHELEGFPDRASTLARYEQQLGRPLQSLDWYEVFAMARIGSCLMSLLRLLRERGVEDHVVYSIPPIQPWTFELMR